MKIDFRYEREKDIWCLLNKGKSSNNSSSPTKIYEQLVSRMEIIQVQKIQISLLINIFSIILLIWNLISGEYQKRAENLFGVTLPKNITTYLTICPYNIDRGYFCFSSIKFCELNYHA